jgi:capsular exopolysaccharide synthesis family protein
MSPANGQTGGAVTVATRHALTAHAAANLVAAERLNDDFNLRDLLRVFLKRKWTILIIFTVFAVFSVVRTYMAQPIYRASTTIQIERFSPRVLDYKEVTPSESYDTDNGDFYTTNYELLKSRTLSERAVEDLGMRKAPPPDAGKEPVNKAVTTSMLEDIITRIRRGPPPSDVDAATREDNALVGAFLSSITVEPVRRSRLVRLYFDSTDPFFAAKAVNTLAQSFININLERRFEASAYAKTFLEEKLGQTKAKLEDSEADLVKFSREAEVFNLDEKQNISNANVQEYSSALGKAEQDRIKAEALYRQAVENPDSIPTIVRESRNIYDIKERKGKLEAEYQDNLRIYKPAFPKMQALKSQIDEVDRQLQSEYERIRQGTLSAFHAARAQEQMLRDRLDAGKQQVLDMQARSVRYGILKREVDTNRELYNGLLQRLKEVGVAGGVGINNISVVDKAQVPLFPYKPDFGRSIATGLAIGLAIGLLVAWLLEHLDDSIRFADEVEKETGVAVLGVVPKLKALEPGKRIALSPHLDPTSAFSEAYRSVRTALQFSTASGAPRRLVVTSSSKNEGKSTTALALAINFAQMGKPVLIVDADLRNPVLHKLMQVDNGRGLSNYLSGNVGVMEVVHRSEIPGLFVMTTGPLPPNPVELLSSAKMHTLLEQCGEHFAHVVVDGPPVLGIADAIVLGNQVEDAVFVIESGRTRKGHAKAALKRLYQAGVHPLGVILTKIDAYHDLYGYGASYYQYAKPAIPAKKTAEA